MEREGGPEEFSRRNLEEMQRLLTRKHLPTPTRINVNDGVEGMYFIQQSVASSKAGGAWLPLKHKRARK